MISATTASIRSVEATFDGFRLPGGIAFDRDVADTSSAAPDARRAAAAAREWRVLERLRRRRQRREPLAHRRRTASPSCFSSRDDQVGRVPRVVRDQLHVELGAPRRASACAHRFVVDRRRRASPSATRPAPTRRTAPGPAATASRIRSAGTKHCASTSNPVVVGKHGDQRRQVRRRAQVHPDVTAPARAARARSIGAWQASQAGIAIQRDACSVHWFRYSRRNVFSCAGNLLRPRGEDLHLLETAEIAERRIRLPPDPLDSSSPRRPAPRTASAGTSDRAPGSPAPSSRGCRAPTESNAGRSPAVEITSISGCAPRAHRRRQHVVQLAGSAPRAARRKSPSTH